MTWADLQPFATALGGIAGIAGIVFSVATERHPLRLVERLTAIADSTNNASVRRLVEDYRDERSATWVLLRRAPAFAGMKWAIGVVWTTSAFTFAFWILTAVARTSIAAGWAAYFVAVGFALVGRLLLERRRSLRRRWIEQEGSWRNLELMKPSSPVAPARERGSRYGARRD